MKKPTYATRIEQLFDEAEGLTTPGSHEQWWLQILREDALRKTIGWKAAFGRYVHRLRDKNLLRVSDVDHLSELATACDDGDPGWEPLLVPLVWCLAISGAATTWQFLHWSPLALAVLSLIMVTAAARWASVRLFPAHGEFSNFGPLKRWLAITVVAIGSTMVAMTLSLVTHNIAWKISTRRFESNHSDQLQAGSAFSVLRALAFDSYGVTLVLGDAAESWGATTLAFPGASVASMDLRPGYCTLNIFPNELLRWSERVATEFERPWLEGVMAHELAHCLDIPRDLPPFGSKSVGTRSIAPADVAAIHDVDTFVAATKRVATQQWQEAFSDTFAVGFWRLTAPMQAAALAKKLHDKRVDSSGEDKTHSTACWIDHALAATPPTSLKELVTWSDRQRASAKCSTHLDVAVAAR